MPGFALGLLVLNVLAMPAGAPLAMLAALAAMLAWSGGLILWRVRRLRAARVR
jgi:predicted small integral membrane protein